MFVSEDGTPLKRQPTTPGGVDPRQQGDDVAPEDDRVIPNAGVYGQQQANAQLAYQNAVTQAQTRKNSLYHQYGLTNTGEVDPTNQYGRYQSLLHQQGSGLDQVQENAMQRGLGAGPGLGNQAERGLRYANAVQNLGFQGDVNQIGTDYGLAMGDAEVTRRNAMTQALQEALSSSWGDWTPPDMGEAAAVPSTTQTRALTSLKKATVPKKSPYTAVRPGGPRYKPTPKKKPAYTAIGPGGPRYRR